MTKTKPLCGAKTRSGTPCTKVAGQGTAFEGQEGQRCYLHGGRAPHGPGQRKLMENLSIPDTGLTFGFLDRKLKSRVEEFAGDPQILSLKREIGLCRARLEMLEGDTSLETAYLTAALTQAVGKLVERTHRIEMERQGLVQLALVRGLFDSWKTAINEVLADPDLRDLLVRRMLSLSRSKLALMLEVSTERQFYAIPRKDRPVVARGLFREDSGPED